jgi:CheY-like chemotaxis protein
MSDLGTVMIIDDEEIDQKQYRRLLGRSGRAVEILQFTYADEALAWLKSHRGKTVDVIFLDVNMPRMNGFEFLEALSAERDPGNLRIILMLTTSLAPKDKLRAMAHPLVKGFFNKPLSTLHLDEACRLLDAA